MNALGGGRSAILDIPKLTKDQLQSESFLRKEVQRLNKHTDRNRRREASELRRNIKQAEINLVKQKSLVPFLRDPHKPSCSSSKEIAKTST